MAEDTAVLEPVTADPEPSPLPYEEPETEALIESPETEGLDETPETEDAENPFEGKTAEEINDLIEAARKDAAAKTAESERRKYEAKEEEREAELRKAVYQQRITQAEQQRKGGYAQSLNSGISQIVKHAIETGESVSANPQWLDNIAAQHESLVAMEQHLARVEAEDQYLAKKFPDYRPSQEIVRGLEKANASRDAEAMLMARMDQLMEAIREEAKATARADIEAEAKAKAETEAKVKGAQNGAAARSNGPTAIQGGGSGGPVIRNFDDAEAAYANGRISDEQMRKYVQKWNPKAYR